MKKARKNYRVKQWILSVVVVVAAMALVTGVGMAWFVNQYHLSSIGRIHPLSYISILAPGDAVIQSIDLSYDKSEVKNGIVELKRPFVIRSESEKYDLCIAHTTNISGLRIKLYQANASGEEGNAYLAGITEKGTPYYWNKDGDDQFTKGVYLNKSTTAEYVADPKHQAHNETFRLTEIESYNNVQKHAEPLYWVKKGIEGQRRTQNQDDPVDTNYYTNYILEITWNETNKETDILYVIAQTSDGK